MQNIQYNIPPYKSKFNIPMYMTIENIQTATLGTIEAFLDQNFKVYIPSVIDTVEEIREANVLLSRYASYEIYLLEVYTKIKIRKRLVKAAGVDQSVFDDWLSKEELFKTYMENAKEAHDTIWQMLKSRTWVVEEMRCLHSTP